MVTCFIEMLRHFAAYMTFIFNIYNIHYKKVHKAYHMTSIWVTKQQYVLNFSR